MTFIGILIIVVEYKLVWQMKVLRSAGRKEKEDYLKKIRSWKMQARPTLRLKVISVKATNAPLQQALCKCKYECKRLPYDQKLLLFDEFYKTKYSKSQNYILGLIQVKHVARRRHGLFIDATKSRRQTTMMYTVPNGEGEILQACKNTFCNIFAVSGKRCHL